MKSEVDIINNLSNITAIITEIHKIVSGNSPVFVEPSSPIKNCLEGRQLCLLWLKYNRRPLKYSLFQWNKFNCGENTL